MSKPVAILDPSWRQLDELFSPSDLEQLSQVCELVWAKDEPMPRDLFQQNLNSAHFLISAEPAVNAADIQRASNLRAIIEVGGVFPDAVDYGACFSRGIDVLSSSPGFRESVAEMAVGLALAGARGIVVEHEAFRRGSEHWLDDNLTTDFSLYDASIGFIGLGSVARETLRLLHPFRPVVQAYDPWVSAATAAELGVKTASLEEVMRSSRCLFIAAAPTHDNRGLVGRDQIAMMPAGALMVVISRAHLVDFDALVAAVSAGKIRAAVDVFPEEPIEQSDPIRALEGFILSPHRAAAVRDGRRLIGRMIVKDVLAMIKGDAPTELQQATADRVAHLTGVPSSGSIVSMAARRRG